MPLREGEYRPLQGKIIEGGYKLTVNRYYYRGWGESCVIGVAAAGKEIATRPFQVTKTCLEFLLR
jgi:hypothetical protein